MPEEKNKTLEDHLIEKIKKSGYPLEIELSNLLDKEYVVFNTQYYFDEEGKQGRDIDIYAMPSDVELDKKLVEIGKKLLPFRLRTELVIECKKTETHAWVFYNRHKIQLRGHHISGQLKTSVPKPRKFSTDSFEWTLKMCLALHHNEFEQVAIAYDEIKKRKLEKENKQRQTQKENPSRREIFEAINQLVKFSSYEMHQIFSRVLKLPKPPSDQELIVIFFPIIAFDGDMFEVTFDSGKPNLERKNHILLRTHYRCPYCHEVESFLIDVVHRSYFSEFMKILSTDFHRIRENMLQKHEELVTNAKEDRIKCETTEGTFG